MAIAGERIRKLHGFDLIHLVLSLLLIASVGFFAYGFAAARYRIFPYTLIRDAGMAAKELWSWASLQLPKSADEHPFIIPLARQNAGPLGRLDPDRSFDGLILIENYTYERFAVGIIDRQGNLVHQWRVPESVYDQVHHETRWSFPREYVAIQGTHLYENGDLLLNLFVHGLLMLDRCGAVKWLIKGSFHHVTTVDEDGLIWSLTRSTIDDPSQALPGLPIPYVEDQVVRVTPTGEVMDRRSVPEAILRGGYNALLREAQSPESFGEVLDITHTNDIEIASVAFARHHVFVEPGDIMLSMRTISALVIIDPEEWRVKWAVRGPFWAQHDPDLHPDGSVSVFDNRSRQTGYSRIDRFDPATLEVLWRFGGNEREAFFSAKQGDHEFLPNGNVLVTESDGGRVLQVDTRTNEVVWEWYNWLELPDGTEAVGQVTRAQGYSRSALGFLGQACPAS